MVIEMDNLSTCATHNEGKSDSDLEWRGEKYAPPVSVQAFTFIFVTNLHSFCAMIVAVLLLHCNHGAYSNWLWKPTSKLNNKRAMPAELFTSLILITPKPGDDMRSRQIYSTQLPLFTTHQFCGPFQNVYTVFVQPISTSSTHCGGGKKKQKNTHIFHAFSY